jgi:hypothetical protein
MFFHDLLAFRVCVVKSAIILMDLPLYVTHLFSFAVFRGLCLFSMFSVLIMLCLGVFFLFLFFFLVLTVWCSVSFLHLDDFLFSRFSLGSLSWPQIIDTPALVYKFLDYRYVPTILSVLFCIKYGPQIHPLNMLKFYSVQLFR